MRDKFLLSIILVLVIAIGYVNIRHINFDTNNTSDNHQQVNGKVLAANIDNDKYSFRNKLTSIPQKNENYYEPDNIWADSYILIDADSSQVLAKYDESNIVPIASTTKIMTAIVTIENYNLDEVANISEEAAYQTPSVIGLIPQEKISIRNLLYGLLINSGNDAAYALAEHIGFDNFIKKMNDKATYLGLKDTHFKDPAGLDDDGRSSARDLAFLTAYALNFDLFKEIIKTTDKTVASIDESYTHQLKNSNRLIQPEELLYFAPAIGVKTGYTPDAGHCLVSAAEKDGHTLIAVILKTTEETNDASAKESKKLLEWGFENYAWQ